MLFRNKQCSRIRKLKPVKGGLFDPALVGVGDKWAKISLSAPMPNPAFEKQIQQFLGITNAQLRAVLAGEMTLDEVQGKSEERKEK